MSRLTFLLLVLQIIPSCDYEVNRYNPKSPEYVSPSFIVDVNRNDTAVGDSVRVIVKGNDRNHRNQFRYSLDNGPWTGWMGDRQERFVIEEVIHDTGTHYLAIQGCYDPEYGDYTDTVLFFYKPQPPVILHMTDSIVHVDAGSICTLSIDAGGTGSIFYQWFRDTVRIDSGVADSLIVKTSDYGDTVVSFHCTVTNKWGGLPPSTFVVKPQFRIIFDGNRAGSGNVPDTIKAAAGELTALPSSGDLVRTGFFFIGWNTRADGTGTGFKIGEFFVMGKQHTVLYGVWTANPVFTVEYMENGADRGETPENNYYQAGDIVVIAGNNGGLEKNEYNFVGWRRDDTGETEEQYYPNDRFVMPSEKVTLIAQWTINPTWALTYLGNGNSRGKAPATVSAEVGKEIKIAAPGTMQKQGYSFYGWSREPNEESIDYKESDPYAFAKADDTLYAQWKINQYTVSYDGNATTVENVPLKTTHRYNSNVTLDTAIPTRKGFVFFRWNTTSKGVGEDYKPGETIRIGDTNIVLYARWKSNRYFIAYVSENHTSGSAPDTMEVDCDSEVKIAGAGSLVRAGYMFVGWNTKGDGSGISYPADTTIRMGVGDMTLYAKWTPPEKIAFQDPPSNGVALIDPGTIRPVTVQVYDRYGNRLATATQIAMISEDEEIGVISGSPVMSNDKGLATFRALVTNGDLHDTFPVVATLLVNGATDRAKLVVGPPDRLWPYTITYHLSGGTNDSNPDTYTIETPTIILSDATRKFYVFDGWYAEENMSTKVDSIPIGSTGDKDLWAKWVIKDADGNIYTEVEIGNQVWMAENLKTTKYNDGTTIPNVTDNSLWANLYTPGYCWYNNDSINKVTDGALYNWYTVNTGKLAPAGWHVPSDTEWTILKNYLIDSGYNWDGTTTGNKIAKSMAATGGWNTYSTEGTIGADLSKNNKCGFSAFPGGYRNGDGTFGYSDYCGYWWSATKGDGANAWTRSLGYNDQALYRGSNNEWLGFTIRCLRD